MSPVPYSLSPKMRLMGWRRAPLLCSVVGKDIAATLHNPISYVAGNATAGALSEVFRIDVIAALGRCRH